MPVIVDSSLTPAFIEVYHAIREALIKHKIAPSQKELQTAVGCSATTIVKAISALKKRGYIEQQKFTTRGLSLVDPEIRLSRRSVDPWDEEPDTLGIWH